MLIAPPAANTPAAGYNTRPRPGELEIAARGATACCCNAIELSSARRRVPERIGRKRMERRWSAGMCDGEAGVRGVVEGTVTRSGRTAVV